MAQPTPYKRVSPFKAIRHEDEDGEFWSARELAKTLEYSGWQRFIEVIQRAMKACEISEQDVADHFNETVKMVTIGSDAQRRQVDYNYHATPVTWSYKTVIPRSVLLPLVKHILPSRHVGQKCSPILRKK